MSGLPTFHTARLILRPLAARDFDDLYRLIYADPEVNVHFSGQVTEEEAARVHARKVGLNQRPDNQGYGYWAVVHRDSGTLLGQILMGPPESAPWIVLPKGAVCPPLDKEVELGYALGRVHWGQGYAAEASRRVIRYAFEDIGLRRFVSSCRRANSRSIRLLRRLGFEIHDNLEDPENVVGILCSGRTTPSTALGSCQGK